jgi:hypothetical protein
MIKMTFGVKQSPEVPGISVYCATEASAAQINFEAKKGYLNIGVSGTVRILEDGETLLITYQALVDFEGAMATPTHPALAAFWSKLGLRPSSFNWPEKTWWFVRRRSIPSKGFVGECFRLAQFEVDSLGHFGLR